MTDEKQEMIEVRRNIENAEAQPLMWSVCGRPIDFIASLIPAFALMGLWWPIVIIFTATGYWTSRGLDSVIPAAAIAAVAYCLALYLGWRHYSAVQTETEFVEKTYPQLLQDPIVAGLAMRYKDRNNRTTQYNGKFQYDECVDFSTTLENVKRLFWGKYPFTCIVFEEQFYFGDEFTQNKFEGVLDHVSDRLKTKSTPSQKFKVDLPSGGFLNGGVWVKSDANHLEGKSTWLASSTCMAIMLLLLGPLIDIYMLSMADQYKVFLVKVLKCEPHGAPQKRKRRKKKRSPKGDEEVRDDKEIELIVSPGGETVAGANPDTAGYLD